MLEICQQSVGELDNRDNVNWFVRMSYMLYWNSIYPPLIGKISSSFMYPSPKQYLDLEYECIVWIKLSMNNKGSPIIKTLNNLNVGSYVEYYKMTLIFCSYIQIGMDSITFIARYMFSGIVVFI